MDSKNKSPLHRRTHWRNLREIITEIAVYEGINISAYDFDNGVCYECSGDELKGKNVTFATSEDRSCWISDNDYEIYEFPKLGNAQGSSLGRFLYISHDTDYDYWTFGILQAAKSKRQYCADKAINTSSAQYYINPLGTYTVTYGHGDNRVKKIFDGYDSMLGFNAGRYGLFDQFGTRKCAYNGRKRKKSKKPITEKSNNVKIYKKRKGPKSK